MHLSLSHRLIILFVIVCAVPIAFISYRNIEHEKNIITNNVLTSLSVLADKKIASIQAYLRERQHDAELLSNQQLFKDFLIDYPHQTTLDAMQWQKELHKINQVAARIIKGEQLFYDLFLINLQGDIQYTFLHESDYQTNLITGPYRTSQLATAFKISSSTLDLGLSDFEYYPPSKEGAAFVTAPMIEQGKLIGVFALQLNTHYLNLMVIEGDGLGRSGEIILLSAQGKHHGLVLTPLKYKEQAELNYKMDIEDSHILQLGDVLRGQRDAGESIDYRGKKVLAAWRYLPELEAAIIVKRDVDEIMQPLNHLKKEMMTLSVIMILLLALFAYLIAKRLIDTLQHYADVSAQIALGALNQRIHIQGSDEIAQFGKAFNQMAQNLELSYQTLEQRIEERTQQLARKQVMLNEAESLGKLGSWELDIVSGKLYWSDEIYHIFELNPEHFKPSYENFLNVIHPKDREKVNQAYSNSLETKKAYDIIHRLLLADGSIKWVHEHCHSSFDDNGTPLRSIGAVQDITEQHLAQNQLRIAAATFETNEAIMITDAHSNILRVNRAFEHITGYAAEEVLGKNPRILSSGRHDRDFYQQMWQSLAEQNHWNGEIWDRRKDGEIYPKWLTITALKNETDEVSEYVAIFSDITERKKAEEEIRTLAYYDSLTSLPNRRLLLDRLGMSIKSSSRNNRYSAVLFIDMDRFKVLNDTLGHEYGDLLLIEVSDRILNCVRKTDTVSRFGGDEFVILLDDVAHDEIFASQKASKIAENIRLQLNQTYQLKDKHFLSSPSIGISLFKDGDRNEIIKQADIAMYQAKESGRNNWHIFNPALQLKMEQRSQLEVDLKLALKNQDQLVLFYQPQLNSDEKLLGFEALIRWQHPDLGLIPPVEFIPLAEESSMIIEIGQWCLQQACKHLERWHKEKTKKHLHIAINISAKEFMSDGFLSLIEKLLAQYHFDRRCLCIEITESLILSRPELAIDKMKQLKQLGIILSLDDFGTGYSSLSYLKRLPVDELKIDQEFVRDLEFDSSDAILIKTICDMAENFQLAIVAEGIENEVQKNVLKEMHQKLIFQGYLFAKPMPLDKVEDFIAQNITS